MEQVPGRSITVKKLSRVFSLVTAILLGILIALGSSPGALLAAGAPSAVTRTTGVESPPGVASAPGSVNEPVFPIRAMFYYPWFPEAWTQQGIFPYTNYHPSLGYYNSSDPAILQQHIAAMQYGGVQAGIASWWGQGSRTDTRIPLLLTAVNGGSFRWGLYYEPESVGDPSVSQITSDLTYIRDHYASDPAYLKVNGRFVVFVYADGADGCGMVDRWSQANTVGAYVVLKVFSGYRACANQPDSWHQYSPAVAADHQTGYNYTISPGFWKVNETPRLVRDEVRWAQNVRDMVASGEPWQLVTTFNEWGEGTAVEAAQEWASSSGYGDYLDVLHNNGLPSGGSPTPTITPSTIPTDTPSRTSTPSSTPTPTDTPTSTPTANVVLQGHVLLQGRPAPPDPRWEVPLTLTLRLSGGSPTNYALSTDSRGYFTITAGLVQGSYQWWVKNPQTLANAGSVTLVGNLNAVEMGTLVEGDVDNDNCVATGDFVILRSTFGKGVGNPGYDPRADLNGDGRVNLSDFTLLRASFGQCGASPPGS